MLKALGWATALLTLHRVQTRQTFRAQKEFNEKLRIDWESALHRQLGRLVAEDSAGEAQTEAPC